MFDGDTISIPKNEEPVLSQLSKAVKSNLNPKFIDVYICGRVDRAGTITVNKATTLSEAIEISGGTKVLKGPVRFLRYNNDGTVDSRKFQFSKSSKRGEYKNPYLRDGDVIYVGRSVFNTTTEILSEVTQPFTSLINAYTVYKIVNPN